MKARLRAGSARWDYNAHASMATVVARCRSTTSMILSTRPAAPSKLLHWRSRIIGACTVIRSCRAPWTPRVRALISAREKQPMQCKCWKTMMKMMTTDAVASLIISSSEKRCLLMSHCHRGRSASSRLSIVRNDYRSGTLTRRSHAMKQSREKSRSSIWH